MAVLLHLVSIASCCTEPCRRSILLGADLDPDNPARDANVVTGSQDRRYEIRSAQVHEEGLLQCDKGDGFYRPENEHC